jgi:hypothetical protein
MCRIVKRKSHKTMAWLMGMSIRKEERDANDELAIKIYGCAHVTRSKVSLIACLEWVAPEGAQFTL